jgi:putative tryptophan/tyrosine transport system substrate-binding protein
MNEKSWLRLLKSSSGNLKSKSGPADQNLKWVGLVALGVTFVLCGALTEAQQQAKVPKIGLLSLRGSGYESFQRELRKLGYIEGKNIVIEFRSADNKLDRLAALADELVRLKVDVLYTRSTTDALS